MCVVFGGRLDSRPLRVRTTLRSSLDGLFELHSVRFIPSFAVELAGASIPGHRFQCDDSRPGVPECRFGFVHQRAPDAVSPVRGLDVDVPDYPPRFVLLVRPVFNVERDEADGLVRTAGTGDANAAGHRVSGERVPDEGTVLIREDV